MYTKKNDRVSGQLNTYFIVKSHQGPHGQVLVVSDEEIKGKKFSEGRLQLDLTKDFYAGEKMNLEEVKKLVKSSYILHLTGKRTVKEFKKLGLVEEKKVLWIKGVPHTEVCLYEN